MSDGRLDGRAATESIESMTDLRQLVSSHCQQHSRHSDTLQPIFASSAVSDLAARAVELTDGRLASQAPFLLRAPPPHHQVSSFSIIVLALYPYYSGDDNEINSVSPVPAGREQQERYTSGQPEAAVRRRDCQSPGNSQVNARDHRLNIAQKNRK